MRARYPGPMDRPKQGRGWRACVRALLVAAVDHPDFVPSIVDGVVKIVVLHTGQPENCTDTVGEQGRDKCFPARHKYVL